MRRLVCAPGPMNSPRPVRVQADGRGRPVVVGGEPVASVREEWLLRLRWWTDDPLRRRYYEVITLTGRRVVVFRDTFTDRWFRQAA